MIESTMNLEEMIKESEKFEETDKFKNCVILDKKLSELFPGIRFPDKYLKEGIITCDNETVAYLLIHYSFNLISPNYYNELKLLASSRENDYVLEFLETKY